MYELNLCYLKINLNQPLHKAVFTQNVALSEEASCFVLWKVRLQIWAQGAAFMNESDLSSDVWKQLRLRCLLFVSGRINVLSFKHSTL